ncbi:MAG: 2-oxo acid dehydrogenase subunit E2, partial [Myxococcaceae bacterium]|nr:2-oxo acid dehydrogenase subunit E2 [Myxococcaceae bacterium]
MPLFRRPDGALVRDEGVTHTLMPFLMPSRSQAQVFLEQKIDVSRLLAHIERARVERPQANITLFTALLCAFVRTHAARPKMNRFIQGGRIYQRHRIEYSFGVKKRLDDASVLTVVKQAFEPDDTLERVAARVQDAIERGRAKRATQSEREMGLLAKFPAPFIRLAIAALRLLDRLNLMPRA